MHNRGHILIGSIVRSREVGLEKERVGGDGVAERVNLIRFVICSFSSSNVYLV